MHDSKQLIQQMEAKYNEAVDEGAQNAAAWVEKEKDLATKLQQVRELSFMGQHCMYVCGQNV